MAVHKSSVMQRLVTTEVNDFERKIDEALQRHAQLMVGSGHEVMVTVEGAISKKPIQEELEKRYKSAGWTNIKFTVEHGDQRDPTITRIAMW